MSGGNICKFNSDPSGSIVCTSFIYETELAQKTRTRAERSFIFLVRRGDGVLVCDSERYPISAGTMFFVLKGEHFSVESETELAYYYISFYGRRADEYVERLGLGSTRRVFPSCDALIPFWEIASARAEDDNIDLVSQAVLLWSMSEIKGERRERSDAVWKAVAYTEEHFTDPSLSLSTLADAIGYDSKYLSSLFKKKKGISYTAYLKEMRLQRALFLMEEGIVSVKSVALLSGFSDPLYFSKVFSEYVGTSPKAYISEIEKRSVRNE